MKNKKKIDEACNSELNSIFIKKINRLKKVCTAYSKALDDRKEYTIQTYKFIKMLLDQNRVTKDELREFYKGKKRPR